MTKTQFHLLLTCLSLSLFGWAQQTRYPSEAIFIENKGQWDGPFDYKLRINGGAFFFEPNGFSLVIKHNDDATDAHVPHNHGNNTYEDEAIGLRLRWQQAQIPYITQSEKLKQTHNYILGNDSSRWQKNVSLSKALTYYDLYPGVNLTYFGNGADLEYDIIIEPNADPSVIKYTIEGATNLSQKGDVLTIETAFGNLVERIPIAYQEINGMLYEVRCRYTLQNGIVGFNLGTYDPNYAVTIDPVLEFSTMTGSSADNFGFTATYDDAGNFYAGGIVSASGYPITTGTFQAVYAGGGTDVGITKFNANGTQALYSTYIGGNDLDLPHSMICAADGTLYILGNTSSTNFPMYASAYQDSNSGGTPVVSYPWEFPNGSDIFIVALDPTGGSLAGGTYLGGNGADGANSEINQNYGDLSRGEIILDDQNNVFITSTTQSTNITFNGTAASLSGNQDALIASFNSDLSVLRWATFYGGSNDESGYSLKLDGNNKVFVSGTSNSGNLNLGANSGVAFSARKSGLDGFIARFDAATGQLERASYLGSAGKDQSFFVDIDKRDHVYTYGQTTSNLVSTSGTYSNPGSQQFITKLNNNLDVLEFYTTVGSGQAKSDLVPTAFLVDDCYKIYISGWNGTTNKTEPNGAALGNTRSLPTTADAYQSTTDASDFYFMVLERDASSLIYASYFGGATAEHVDGGTSRFDPKGIIYQAVCASCGSRTGFPTTPGAYSETNGSSNCNLGAIKFDFQTAVKAVGAIDFSVKVDTVCNTLFVDFDNNSVNSNAYVWDFGNGQTSTQRFPTTTYDQFGTYTIKLVAIDTICDLKDSMSLTLTHDKGVIPKAGFTVNYADCDKTYEATFDNISSGSTNYEWDFGDGSTSNDEEPIHNFPGIGVYDVTLTARDTICGTQQSIVQQVEFTDTLVPPTGYVRASECMDGSLDVSILNAQPWYKYTWADDFGNTFSGESPRIVFTNSGFHFINLVVLDTICKALYKSIYKVRVAGIQAEVFIPNAFTPNADDKNEKFLVYGNRCTVDDRFLIYDRWGRVVFETNNPYTEFWDATIEGKPAKEDVYVYMLKRGSEIQRGQITLIR